jgi:predicted metal-binding membrane protein
MMSETLSVAERLMRRDRLMVVFSLFVLTFLSWLYLFLLAGDMAQGDMRLMGMGRMAPEMLDMIMPMPWDTSTFVLMGLMWWVMMVGMMIPSAAPMILLYARVQRKNLPHENPVLRITLFTLGYLLLWLLFSVAATLLQWTLSEWELFLPAMKTTGVYTGALLFALAGLYQLTPLKLACLKNCQAPLQFLTTCWRNGNKGAVVMGMHHGAYCVGCCWCLMLLLFVGGVMNLLWIAAIAIIVLLEKLLPGKYFSWTGGLLLLLMAVWLGFPQVVVLP